MGLASTDSTWAKGSDRGATWHRCSFFTTALSVSVDEVTAGMANINRELREKGKVTMAKAAEPM